MLRLPGSHLHTHSSIFDYKAMAGLEIVVLIDQFYKSYFKCYLSYKLPGADIGTYGVAYDFLFADSKSTQQEKYTTYNVWL